MRRNQESLIGIFKPKISWCLAVLMFTSCSRSSSLGPKSLGSLDAQFPSISLAQVPQVSVTPMQISTPTKPELGILAVEDNRPEKVVLRYEEKEIVTTGDPTLGIRYALQKAFRQKGFTVKDGAAAKIRVKVSDWKCRMQSGEALCDASVYGQLVGPSGKNIFSSIFEGSATASGLRLTDRDIERAMLNAMSKALSELVNNGEMIELAQSY